MNEKGHLQMALKNQIYKYVISKGELFDPDELTDECQFTWFLFLKQHKR